MPIACGGNQIFIRNDCFLPWGTMDFLPCTKPFLNAAHELLREYTRTFGNVAVVIAHRKPMRTFLLRDGHAIAGVAEVAQDNEGVALGRMMVAAQYRGSGVGKQLLEACIHLVPAGGVMRALVPAAYHALFVACGFEMWGEMRCADGRIFAVMQWDNVHEAQVQLNRQLGEIALHRSVEDETSMRLRKLHTRGKTIVS